MTITRVHHIEITVPVGAEDAARQFYCRNLGLKEIPKPDSLKHRGGFWATTGNIDIHIGIEDGIDRSKTKVHIAYEVDDLEKWRKKLEALGISIKESIPIPSCDRFEFRDPFGNRVELILSIPNKC